MYNKYELLLSTLDSIIKEAPNNYERYNVFAGNINPDKLNQARSRALIHLFLKTRFGILDFKTAEEYITDGPQDGGLDAYYIDYENKKIYLVQSKFRVTEENFEINPVNGYELFKMELEKIIKEGSLKDYKNIDYNNKIWDLQKKIRDISNIGIYRYVLVFLGNIPDSLESSKLNAVSGAICDNIEIINGLQIYSSLLLPYLQSDFYNRREFVLKIKVNQDQSNRIKYGVTIGDQLVSINLSFVPTIELARMMSEYKNSLLRYNPRCFVGFKNNGVNKQIYETISVTSSNEFSLLNNGITIICTDFGYTEQNACPGIATLLITNPQIVNGGQTAFTLATLYSENKLDLFLDKEVLIKFITLGSERNTNHLELVQKISEATNNQTPVALSDRKSNDDKFIEFQKYLFEKHALLLERKKGEFYDAQKKIDLKDKIINKTLILRLCFAKEGKVSEARNYSDDKLFQIFPLSDVDFEVLYKLIKIYKLIDSVLGKKRKSEEKYLVKEWGNGLRYGKFAIVFATFLISQKQKIEEELALKFVKYKWNDFEATVSNNTENEEYSIDGFNYDNYYKGRTINLNLKEYFDNDDFSKGYIESVIIRDNAQISEKIDTH